MTNYAIGNYIFKLTFTNSGVTAFKHVDVSKIFRKPRKKIK